MDSSGKKKIIVMLKEKVVTTYSSVPYKEKRFDNILKIEQIIRGGVIINKTGKFGTKSQIGGGGSEKKQKSLKFK